MPSGELLAPSLFTESGIQSVRSTNEVDNSENVVSKFLSQPARNYISGSEVGTIEQVVKLSDTNAAAAAIFTLPSNCDVITGVSLTVLNTAKNTTNSTRNLRKTVSQRKIRKLLNIPKLKLAQ